MRLLTRLILGIVILIAVAVLLGSSLLQRGLGASYEEIERDAAQREMQRLVTALEGEARSLSQLLLGWAHWSEMHAYVINHDPAFRSENLCPQTLVPSDLAWVLVFGPDNTLLDAIAEPSGGKPVSLSALEASDSPLRRAFSRPLPPNGSQCGITVLEGERFIACRMPIRDTRAEHAPRGFVVLARRFDAPLLQRVKDESHLDFRLASALWTEHHTQYPAPRLESRVFGNATTRVRASADALELQQALFDLNGDVFAALELNLPRTISALGRSSLNRVRMQLAALAVLLAALLAFGVERILVFRLRRLSEEIDRIWQARNWTLRVSESQDDEIGRLASHTNALLDVLGGQLSDLEQRAMTDSLTGLANRRAFDQALDLAIRRQQRSGARPGLALIMIDIDFFKPFNDVYGHAAGDHALERMAGALREVAARAGDLAARLGGEEFGILLGDCGKDAALEVAERLRQAVEALAIPHSGSPATHLTVSIGVALCGSFEGGESLYLRADAALYRAKEHGRNRVALALLDG